MSREEQRREGDDLRFLTRWGPLGRFAVLAAGLVSTAAVGLYRVNALENGQAELRQENKEKRAAETDIRERLIRIEENLQQLRREARSGTRGTTP